MTESRDRDTNAQSQDIVALAEREHGQYSPSLDRRVCPLPPMHLRWLGRHIKLKALLRFCICSTSLVMDVDDKEDVQMAPADVSEGPDFFDYRSLPQELRDAILEELFASRVDFELAPHPAELLKSSSNTGNSAQAGRDDAAASEEEEPIDLPEAHVKYLKATNILLVSKDIKEDYENQWKKHAVFVLNDHDHYNFKRFLVPTHLLNITNVEMNIILFCHRCLHCVHKSKDSCRAVKEIGFHEPWIATTIEQLKNLRNLVIHIYLSNVAYNAPRDSVPCEQYVIDTISQYHALPCLQLLDVCKYDYTRHPAFDGPKVKIHEWTRTGGVSDIQMTDPEVEEVSENEKPEQTAIT
jgi:hypothetical protein